jgi:hypothetical protein
MTHCTRSVKRSRSPIRLAAPRTAVRLRAYMLVAEQKQAASCVRCAGVGFNPSAWGNQTSGLSRKRDRPYRLSNNLGEMLLAIYLNDHLAGATAGRELGRRAAGSNRDSSHGPFLADLADQIDADRGSLMEIMRVLNVKVDRIKVLGGWGAEKLARLKLNGQLWGYSPLSRIVELEALSLGVRGKLALWRTLRELDLPELSTAPVSLADLIARAEQQLAGLESHRLQAVAQAFS